MFLCNLLFWGDRFFLSEHELPFILIGLYFTKKHIWRVKIFHKTFTILETFSNVQNSY